jgi:cell wall-associated NlpC family hydrolase
MIYFALNDIPIVDGVRQLLKGTVPTGTKTGAKTGAAATALGSIASKAQSLADAASTGTATNAFGQGTGAAIAADAHKYLGVRYVWGGADPSGFDCSGLVTWVLHHDLGYNLPSNTHTVTGQWLVWGGATDVPRSQAAAGDLCCSLAHIGIAVDNQNMIHAPDVGDVVKVGPIQAGMAIRRVKDNPAYTGAENANTGRL